MKNKVTLAIATLAAVAVVSTAHSSYSSVQAQATKSTTDGVFTAEQAKRGEKVYTENCGFCHGDDLKGDDLFMPLTGDAFVSNWAKRPIVELYDKILQTMPPTAPGTLTPAQSADALAFILSVGKHPAGAKELAPKADELKQIVLDAPKP